MLIGPVPDLCILFTFANVHITCDYVRFCDLPEFVYARELSC